MRVLMLHNYYQQPGGEDGCFVAEASLLESRGHEVDRFVLHNDSVEALGRGTLAAKTLWNREVYRDLRRQIRLRRPDVMHAHNIFPLISPSAYFAASAEGVPVVQTVHNYRLFCVNAMFFRDGRPCEDCLGRMVPWPGIAHRCYRGSALLSGGVAGLIVTHRLLGTLHRKVDVLIALTRFVQAKLIDAGVPASMVQVKPNFLATDPGVGGKTRGNFALFVGRLSPEKGVATLVKSWAGAHGNLGLKIVGDGPFAAGSATLAAGDPRIEFLGRRSPAEVMALMREAIALIVPSEWYETFGRVVIEAFASGTPVIAARIGAIAELVDDRRTGLLFRPGDAEDLTRCVAEMIRDNAAYRGMQLAARADFDGRYTAAVNYDAMMRIYATAGAVRTEPPPMYDEIAPISSRLPPNTRTRTLGC